MRRYGWFVGLVCAGVRARGDVGVCESMRGLIFQGFLQVMGKRGMGWDGMGWDGMKLWMWMR